MKQIFEFLKGFLSSKDLVDGELYFQILGRRVAETGVAKAKGKQTIIREEDGNSLTINVTEIGRLDCGHWNVDLGGQCCVCGSTYCKYCISEKIGFSCLACGRFVCPSCARFSIIDAEIVLCGHCGPLKSLSSIIRRYLCES